MENNADNYNKDYEAAEAGKLLWVYTPFKKTKLGSA